MVVYLHVYLPYLNYNVQMMCVNAMKGKKGPCQPCSNTYVSHTCCSRVDECNHEDKCKQHSTGSIATRGSLLGHTGKGCHPVSILGHPLSINKARVHRRLIATSPSPPLPLPPSHLITPSSKARVANKHPTNPPCHSPTQSPTPKAPKSKVRFATTLPPTAIRTLFLALLPH
jgi:hypothetical protein